MMAEVMINELHFCSNVILNSKKVMENCLKQRSIKYNNILWQKNNNFGKACDALLNHYFKVSQFYFYWLMLPSLANMLNFLHQFTAFHSIILLDINSC